MDKNAGRNLDCDSCGLCCKLFGSMCLSFERGEDDYCIHQKKESDIKYGCGKKLPFARFKDNECKSKKEGTHERALEEIKHLEEMKRAIRELGE